MSCEHFHLVSLTISTCSSQCASPWCRFTSHEINPSMRAFALCRVFMHQKRESSTVIVYSSPSFFVFLVVIQNVNTPFESKKKDSWSRQKKLWSLFTDIRLYEERMILESSTNFYCLNEFPLFSASWFIGKRDGELLYCPTFRICLWDKPTSNALLN